MIHAEKGRVAIAFPKEEGPAVYLAELTAVIAAVRARLKKEPGMTDEKANELLTQALFMAANAGTTEETEVGTLAEFFEK